MSDIEDRLMRLDPDLRAETRAILCDVAKLQGALAAERAAHAKTRERLSEEANAATRSRRAPRSSSAVLARAEKAERELVGDLAPVEIENAALRASLAQAVEALECREALGKVGCGQCLSGICDACTMEDAALRAARKLLNPEVGT